MMNKTRRYQTAAVLAVLAMSVNIGDCKDGLEGMRGGMAGFETGMDIKEMRGALRLEIAVPQPEAAAPAAPAAGCGDVDAMVETMARVSLRSDLARLTGNSREYRLAVIDGGIKCERLEGDVLRLSADTMPASPAFEFSAPAPAKNGRRTHWEAPAYPPDRKIVKGVVYTFSMADMRIIGRNIIAAGK